MKTSIEYESLLSDVKTEFPDFKIVEKKSSSLMKAIDVVLKVITFGQMKAFMTSFITTLGNTVYVPAAWDTYTNETKMSVVRHERVHMRQSKKHGRFLFSLMYLFLPFPILFASCRRDFEMEAYEESMKASLEYYGEAAIRSENAKQEMLKHFTTAQYFWTWPWKKSLSKWYDIVVSKLTSSS